MATSVPQASLISQFKVRLPHLCQPLFWVLALLGIFLVFVAGRLGGRYELAMGDLAERLYTLDGFSGAESGPNGTYRWANPNASITMPRIERGALVANLTLFDAAPEPRKLQISLDGVVLYDGFTHVGGTPWALSLPAMATSERPTLFLSIEPWKPPGDSRILGIGFLRLQVDAPDVAMRAIVAECAISLSILLLAGAVARRTRYYAASAAGGIGVLALLGGMLVYGDIWLNRAALAILLMSLVASVTIFTGRPGTPLARRAPLWGALSLAALLLLITLRHFNTGDAKAMYQVTLGLTLDGVPWQHYNHAWIHFGLGQSLLFIPLEWLGEIWSAATGADIEQLGPFCAALLNQLITPATALVLYLGARRRFGGGIALALVGTYLLATPAIPYARLAFAEPLSGLLILSATMLLWMHSLRLPSKPDGEDQQTSASNTKHPSHAALPGGNLPHIGSIATAGLLLGLAILVKPANGIYLPITILYLIWALSTEGGRSPFRWRASSNSSLAKKVKQVAPKLVLFVIGLLPGLLLTAYFDFIRYGSFFTTGYEEEGFTTPLHVGLYGLLFSPGKGIIYFAPPVLLSVWGLVAFWRSRVPQLRAETLLILGQGVIVFIFHALWSSWEGNIAWGPRFLIPFVPFLLWPIGALAQRAWARVAWWALGVVGFLVAIAGTLVDQFYYFDIYHVYAAGTQVEHDMLFTPEWSQIVAHWRFILTGEREPMIIPTLEEMGVPALWDTAVPIAFAALALLALVLCLRKPRTVDARW
jgi:hypothetical protein